MKVRVKVCGITSPGDAAAAADLGADAVGLNFVAASPRRVSPERAREIGRALPPFVQRVGVVVDEPAEELARLARQAELDAFQFHGDESPEDCAASPLPWFKAFRIGPGFQIEELEAYHANLHLLDAFGPGARGGTGRTADWDVAARAARRFRIVLAGGLGPDNILDAVQRVRPHGVDLNSAVESSPGRKDRDALARVFALLRDGGYR